MQLLHYLDFPSKFIPPRQVDIWLPPGFSPDDGSRYPVIYMHDGQNLFDPEHAFIGVDWGIDPALTRLIRKKAIQPPIVVGIWNTPNRIGDYMPEDAFQTAESQQLLRDYLSDRWPDDIITIMGNAYLAFIVRELKPWVDDHFPTLPQAEHTSIMGSSMGGLISLYALCQYPQVFGGAACLSNAWHLGEDFLLDYFQLNLPGPQTHKLYLDMGGHESRSPDSNTSLIYFHKAMRQAAKNAGYTEGKNLLTAIYKSHTHSETDWRRRVHIPLKFLLGSGHS